MNNAEYFRALENFTMQEMPNLTSAEISSSLVVLLSRVIVSAAGGEKELSEMFLETVRHTLDIEVGRSLKAYALT